MVFHPNIKAHHLEHDKKHVLKKQLHITLRLLTDNHLVGSIRKESLQTTEKTVHFRMFHLRYKLADFKRCFRFTLVCIEKHQIIQKAFLYFLIRIIQRIKSKTAVVILYSQISALIDNRNEMGTFRIDTVQHICRNLHSLNFFQPVIMLFQQVNQVRGSTCSKPVIAECHRVERIEQAERIVDTGSVEIKMIAVITFLHFKAHAIIIHILRFGKKMQVFVKILVLSPTL